MSALLIGRQSNAATCHGHCIYFSWVQGAAANQCVKNRLPAQQRGFGSSFQKAISATGRPAVA
ncbi:MAG: hypothetical protein KDA54_03440, partial [Phycisphaerales bacterium]|nr:hypothetical protein [Phycisphaerales bacterium]